MKSFVDHIAPMGFEDDQGFHFCASRTSHSSAGSLRHRLFPFLKRRNVRGHRLGRLLRISKSIFR
jgi:hypothetical protein